MKYEITKVSPDISKMQVKYINEAQQEVFLSFLVDDLSESALVSTAKQGVARALAYFEDLNNKPSLSASIDTFAEKSGEVNVTHREETPPPAIDVLKEYLTKEYAEDNGVLKSVWTVHAYTEEQAVVVLTEWRKTTSVTMRQARLALQQQGLLSTVQANIDLMPEDVQIEWEYALTVDRGASLVSSLGQSLGLTDEQIDELFKLAQTL